MEISFGLLIAFGFTSMLIILEACKKDVDIIDSGRTALDHAYECDDVLGPLPKFSCANAIEVPTTKNGNPVTFPTGEEGNGSTNPNDCDHPVTDLNAPNILRIILWMN